jgi:hypothetical protein
MKTPYSYALLAFVVTAGLVFLGVFTDAKSAITLRSSIEEQWVNANHVRVKVNKQWQEIQLMPLADHLCQSGQPLFERYCD